MNYKGLLFVMIYILHYMYIARGGEAQFTGPNLNPSDFGGVQ